MAKLDYKPIYIMNNNQKAIELLDIYFINKKFRKLDKNLLSSIKNETLYFVPIPLNPTAEANRTRYKLVIANADKYNIYFNDLTFSQSVIQELEQNQAIKQTKEFGQFYAYKVIDKVFFASVYINESNNIKASEIYLLKLNMVNYSIVEKTNKYEKIPFINIKMSDIDKLLTNRIIKQVYYNLDLKNGVIDLENDKDISIQTVIPTTRLRELKEDLWEARRTLKTGRIICAYGHTKVSAILRLDEKCEENVNNQEQRLNLFKEELEKNSNQEEEELE